MRHRLFWLAVAALVPLVALAAGLSVYSLRQQRAALRSEAMHDVADMLDMVERDLLTQISNLQTLAKSPGLDGPEPDLALFHRVAGEVAAELRQWDVIILADLQGNQILHTGFPFGAPLGRVVDDESYRRLISTGAPVVGNVAGPAAYANEGPPRAAVRVPVTRDGALRYVLTAVIEPDHLSELVARKLSPEWRAFLVDRAGRIAASARRPDVIGQVPSGLTQAARAAGPSGIYEGLTPDGVRTVTAFQRSDLIGWSAHVSVPRHVYNAPLARSLWLLGALILGALAFTLMIIEIMRRESLRRERVATQVRDAEARYRLLAENATDVIFRTGLDGKRLYLSPSSRDIYGYEPEELLGTDAGFLIHPDDAPGMNADLAATAAGKPGHETSIYRIRHKAGHWVWLEARRRLVRDEAGAPVEVVGIVRDISERVQLEEQLRQAQKMEAIGQLTGGIAHEFNNLLMVVMGNAEALAEEIPDPGLRSLATMVHSAAERGAELTEKLLAFGRRQSLTPARVDVAEVVTGMAPLLQRTLGETVELRTEQQSGVHLAITDRMLLESAILNLAVNARDAMPAGGRLTIRTGARHAGPGEGPLPIGQAVVYVSVSDTGVGMSPDVRAQAFEPFFTTKDVGEGSGLGLSMVYGFARQAGGHVSIESEVGRGTCVTIVLPAIIGSRPQAGRGAEIRAPAVARKRILMVEDAPEVLQFASSQIASLGYEVTAVSNGPDALGLLAEGKVFDLLFTDVVLPRGMSGADLAEQVGVLAPDTKVVFTSGYPDEVFKQHGWSVNDAVLLRKPYRRKELADTLRRVLDSG